MTVKQALGEPTSSACFVVWTGEPSRAASSSQVVNIRERLDVGIIKR
jgi:hypothetical protein